MRWSTALTAIFFSCIASNASLAQRKTALVIGNDNYKNHAQLDNAGRDARLMAAALKKIGFKLVGDNALIDLNKATIDKVVDAFSGLAQDADIAVFYFSGHGAQIGGTNYLLPVELDSYSPATADLRTLNANLVLKAIGGAKLKIILLDACRTNPFVPTKGQGGGLAIMHAPAGTLIGFATQPGATATQGPLGGNSPYAEALATYLGVRGLELFAMLNEVGLAVMDKTKNQQPPQQPWISASPITGPVILNLEVIAGKPPIRPAPPELLPPTPKIVGCTDVHCQTNGKSLPFVQQAYKQLDKNDYNGARRTLTRAIELDPNFAPTFSYRGFSWYLEGQSKRPKDALEDYRQAFSDLDAAIQLDPSYAPVRRHRGNNILAIYKALKALGKPANDILDHAIDDLKDAVTLDPTSKVSANALGRAHLLKGSYEDAIESFNRAIERDAKYAAAYSGLCFAYRMLGDKAKARKYAHIAANLDDDFSSRPCLNSDILNSDI
jgi:hypothetical protein